MFDTDLYSWVVRGKQRKAIIKIMSKPKIPTEIKEETNLSLNNVSDILRLFVEVGLAKILNPDKKVGRLYVLTKKGEAIRKNILKP